MGIPAYLSYIIRNYPGIVRAFARPRDGGSVADHMYMDTNSIVYDAYRMLENDIINDNTIIDKVISQIELLIDQIRPTRTIFIALDGVAPFAKIAQQRQRRFRVAATSTTAPNVIESPAFSTIKITPGTEFMNLLTMRLTRHFDGRAIISGSDIPGEGEHKIFEHIRAARSQYDRYAIYGLDADLIMLAINHLYVSPNLFIFRETPVFRETSADAASAPYTLLDVAKLAQHIEKHTGADAKPYIFLCFLLGNDFLPHFPALNLRTNGMDILLNSYKKNVAKGSSLIKNGQIQWRILSRILKDIAAAEHNLFIEKTRDRDGLEKRWKHAPLDAGIDPELHAPVIYRELEKYICPEEEGWETRYYRVLFPGMEVADARVSEISLNLLQGLEWTFKYYSGHCMDWRWKYNYYYAPLLSDFVKYIPLFDTEFFASPKNTPLSPYVQLACVLPRKHLTLLPQKLRVFIEENYSHLYPMDNNIKQIWAYCRYNWEAHLVLPEITADFLADVGRRVAASIE